MTEEITSTNGYQALPAATESAPPDPETVRQQRQIVIAAVIGGIVLIALLVLAIWGLTRDAATTAVIRDIFIIFMAVESLLIGLTLVILIVQLARLINLLQNEIKPILDSTNETVSTMRGTVNFLSENLTGPVVKLNEYMAAFSELGKFFRTIRKK